MAMLIRDEHRLPTLRVRLRMRRDGVAENDASAAAHPTQTDPVITRPLLSSQILHGDQAVSPWVDTELEALGIPSFASSNAGQSRSGTGQPSANLTTRLTQSPGFIPNLARTPIAGQIAGLADAADVGPLWLHIAQDSAPLALLPWEAMARALTPIPFVRIPNFLTAPFAPSRRPTIVICASAPVGDGSYACLDFVAAIVAAVRAAASQSGASPTVHIFVDQEIADQTEVKLSPPEPDVHVYRFNPSDSPSDMRTGREIWTDWIVGTLSGQSADIVHFVSPGYLSTDYGAIVLAETPVRNERKGTFLSAGDLIRFYDRVGCTAMAFSNPAMPEWVAGQRSLAFELSWTRAGPIVLTEAPYQALDVLTPIYTLLFGGGDIARHMLAAASVPVQFSCHPSLFSASPMQASAQDDPFKAAAAYVRNQYALQAPTRALSVTEQAERRGSEAAVDFLSSLVGQSRL